MPPDDDNRLEAKAVRSRPRDAVLKRVVVLSVTGVGLYVVWPSLAKVFSAGPMLATVSPLWGFPIAAAEAASFVCMWALLRLALDVKPWFPIAIAQLAGNAFSRSAPGWPPAGGAMQLDMPSTAGIAPPAAAPPGTMRLKALPASCAMAMGNHGFTSRARRRSAHMQTKLAASAAAMGKPHKGLTVASMGPAEKTLSRLGHTT